MPSTTPPISSADALLHLARGLVGEGHGQNLAGPGLAGGEDMGKPGGQHAGLAGAGAGQHEEGAVRRLDGGALFGIEALQIGRLGVRHGPRRHAAAAGRQPGIVVQFVEIDGSGHHAP